MLHSIKPSLLLVAAAAVLGAPGWSQQRSEPENPSDVPRDGWRVFTASAYSGYMHLGLPGEGLNSLRGAVPLGSDLQQGAAMSLGWRRFRKRGGVSFIYEPSYYGLARHSEWSSLNHSIRLRATRTFARRWDAAFSTAATVRSLNGFLFAPSALSGVVAAPGTAGNLADAVLAGRYANQPLASALTGAQSLESPLTAVLYSQRALNASLTGSLTYRRSPRLSLRFETAGWRTQALSSGQPEGVSARAVIQRATTGSVSASVSYSESARTQIGLETSASRQISDFIDAYVTTASATLGRRIGTRWFLQGAAGAALTTPVLERVPLSRNSQLVVRGSVGYRLRTQSFMATFDRAPAGQYGIGGGYSLSSGAAWSWRPPAKGWELSAHFRQQTFRGGSLQELNGWIGGAAVLREVTRRTGVQLAYSYMKNSGTYISGLRNIEVHAVQFSAVWRNQIVP